MTDTVGIGHGSTVGLQAGSDFDRESMVVAGNEFENVELRNDSGYDDLTLSDFEGEPRTDDGVNDDFESGDLNAYSVTEATDANVVEAAAYRGDYGLELDGSGNDNSSGWVRSDSGLGTYPDPDGSWEFWWNTQTEVEFFSVYFAIQSDDRSEAFRLNGSLDSSNQFIELQEQGSNGDKYLGNAALEIDTGTWYRTVVDGTDSDGWTVSVDNGEGTATIAEFTSAATQYTQYQRSGIAYWISGEDHIYLDDVTVRESGGTRD